MIKPGSFVQVDRKLSMVLAAVPAARYVLVLDVDPPRLRELNPVEYLLLAEDEERQEEMAVLSGLSARASVDAGANEGNGQ